MTALAAERSRVQEEWKSRNFTLASGTKAYKNAAVGFDVAAQKIKPMTAASGLVFLGFAQRTVDATSADKSCPVDLLVPIHIEWFTNDTAGGAVTVLLSDCYFKDDQTVTKNAGASPAGRVWALDTALGVAVQKSSAVTGNVANLIGPTQSYTANDLILAASPSNGTVYDVPTTAAASTITLPATTTEGVRIFFAADGTKNAHTVQYRDATGPTNLTTALTASKRHLTVCQFLGGKWTANAYVSP